MLPLITKPCGAGNWHAGRYKPVSGIVIHIMDGTLVGTDALFATPPEERQGGQDGHASSAHYGIGRDGTIHEYVSPDDTAYHAGNVYQPNWSVLKAGGAHYGVNPNSFTVGIEHEGTVDPKLAAKLKFTLDWPDAQQKASADLVWFLARKYNIPIDRDHIVGHHEIYSLKPCPGENAPIDAIIALAKNANA